jgi:hypothetical protein
VLRRSGRVLGGYVISYLLVLTEAPVAFEVSACLCWNCSLAFMASSVSQLVTVSPVLSSRLISQ